MQQRTLGKPEWQPLRSLDHEGHARHATTGVVRPVKGEYGYEATAQAQATALLARHEHAEDGASEPPRLGRRDANGLGQQLAGGGVGR